MKGSANETTNVTEDKIVTMNFIMKTQLGMIFIDI